MNLTPPISRDLIGQPLNLCSLTHQCAETRLKNVRQLNIREGKKLGFQLSHRQPLMYHDLTHYTDVSLNKVKVSWKFGHCSFIIYIRNAVIIINYFCITKFCSKTKEKQKNRRKTFNCRKLHVWVYFNRWKIHQHLPWEFLLVSELKIAFEENKSTFLSTFRVRSVKKKAGHHHLRKPLNESKKNERITEIYPCMFDK